MPSKVRFIPSKTGKVHVVTTPGADKKNSKCGVVKAGHGQPTASGGWGRRKGVSPDAALSMDECMKCMTHAVAQQVIEESKTPAQKRADAKRKRDETLDRLKPMGNRPKRAPVGPDRSTRPSGGGMRRRGPKTSKPETIQMKAEEHAKLAAEHGWASDVVETAKGEWTVTATKGGQELKLIYKDGRTIWSRVTLESGTEIRLRNSANWRKHATGQRKAKEPKRGGASRGKKAARQELEADGLPRLPFDADSDNDTIIESLVGRRITWRNSLSNSLDTAVLPERPRNIRITTHPKSGRRLISFYESQGHHPQHGEMLGCERTVYIDKIIRAK